MWHSRQIEKRFKGDELTWPVSEGVSSTLGTLFLGVMPPFHTTRNHHLVILDGPIGYDAP